MAEDHHPLRDGFVMHRQREPERAFTEKYVIKHPDIHDDTAEDRDEESADHGVINIERAPGSDHAHLGGFYNHFPIEFEPARGIMRDALHRVIRLQHERLPVKRWSLIAQGAFPRSGPRATREQLEAAGTEEEEDDPDEQEEYEKGQRALMDSYARRFGFQVSEPDYLEEDLANRYGVSMHADGDDLYTRSLAHEQPPSTAGSKRKRSPKTGSGLFTRLDPFSIQAYMATRKFKRMQ